MLKTALQLRDYSAKSFLSRSLLILLLTTLMMTTGLQLATHADTHALLFTPDAIKDPGSFAVKLQDRRAGVSKSIAAKLSEETHLLLNKYDGVNVPSLALQNALVSELNRLLQTTALYDVKLFADIQLSEQTRALITKTPKNPEALVRLNRFVLADAYPYELSSPSKQQPPQYLTGIEACRENLRQIMAAREDYRDFNANAEPQWLSDLSPRHVEKETLICPADATAGTPGVLTPEAADPRLPCSYLYEIRPSEKANQQWLLAHEGDMRPIIRCEHHFLNLSVGGKLYRNGPQRDIYSSNKTNLSLLVDFMQDLRTELGAEFLRDPEGRTRLKKEAEKLIIKELVPRIRINLAGEVYSELEKQLGKDVLNTPAGMDIFKDVMGQVLETLEKKIHTHLQAEIGEEFLKTQEGNDILQQLSALTSK